MRRVVREHLRKTALPARGASCQHQGRDGRLKLCLGAACTGCILMQNKIGMVDYLLCLGAACTGCIGKS